MFSSGLKAIKRQFSNGMIFWVNILCYCSLRYLLTNRSQITFRIVLAQAQNDWMHMHTIRHSESGVFAYACGRQSVFMTWPFAHSTFKLQTDLDAIISNNWMHILIEYYSNYKRIIIVIDNISKCKICAHISILSNIHCVCVRSNLSPFRVCKCDNP